MIFILSMHRSGSSLLAGLLKANGMSLGNDDELIEARSDNPLGFNEREDVVEFNKKLLHRDGYTSMLPNPIFSYNDEDTHNISELKRKLDNEEVRLIKDPRLCLSLPIWKKFYPDAKVILLFRHPVQVANSLEKRQNFPFTAGLAVWEYYNLNAIEQATGLDLYICNFEELKQQPETEIKKIINWLTPDVEIKDISSDFYDQNLIHNNGFEQDKYSISTTQQHLYSALVKKDISSLKLPQSNQLHPTLNILAEFHEKGFNPINGRLLDKRAKDIIKKTRATLNEKRDTLWKTSSDLKDTQWKLKDTQWKLKDTQWKLKQTKQNLTENKKEHKALIHKNKVQKQHIEKLERLINKFVSTKAAKYLNRLFNIKNTLTRNNDATLIERMRRLVNDRT